jgi:hypothetical protein
LPRSSSRFGGRNNAWWAPAEDGVEQASGTGAEPIQRLLAGLKTEMGNRDDFSAKVKQAVAARAGWHCSFSGCAKLTVGPSEEAPDAHASIGEAAPICAAFEGGRRYDTSMTPEERSDFDDAIWLCSDHAKLIDRDEVTHTAHDLRPMKREHEATCTRAVRTGSSLHIGMASLRSRRRPR